MTCVYVADALTEERSALRLIVLDLNMKLAGEAAGWATVLAQAPVSFTDMLLIDWDLLPCSSPTARWMNSAEPVLPRWSLCSYQPSGRSPASRPLLGRRCVYQ